MGELIALPTPDEHLLGERREAALRRLPMPWVDDAATYERAVSSRQLRQLAARWTPADGGLLVLGSTGLGKTAAVACALRRLVRAATNWRDPTLRTHWTNASAIALARRHTGLGAGEAAEIRRAIEAPVLVVDELGPEPLDAALHDVLDARYTHQRVTLATSGMSLAELRERYGAARIRRITAPHGAVVEVRP